jgi:hypothetical protein
MFKRNNGIIHYINDVLLDKIFDEIDDVKVYIKANQTKIDIKECVGILKQLRKLEIEVNEAIVDTPEVAEEASDDEKSEFEKELEKRKI